MSAVPSLFDQPATSPFGVAVSLCVIAIAFVGLRMMTGHLAARDGLRVVIACFVLLGAATIAAGLQRTARQVSPAGSDPVQAQALSDPPPLAPAADPFPGGPSLQPDQRADLNRP